MHVFDVSYNQLSGALPSFLDFTNVPEYVQRGIFIAVSHLFLFPGNFSCLLSLADDCSQLLLSVHAVTSRMGLGGMHDCAWQCCRPAVLPSVLAILEHHASSTYDFCKGCFVCLTRHILEGWAFMCRATTSRTPAALSSLTSMTSACPLPRRPLSCPPWAPALQAPGQPPLACPAQTRRCRPTTAACPARCSIPGSTYPGSQGSPPQNPSNPSTASASADGNPVDTQA